MIIKMLWGCVALYHLVWTGNIILGFLALVILSQLEIISKLDKINEKRRK
jgi:hypothetical protein